MELKEKDWLVNKFIAFSLPNITFILTAYDGLPFPNSHFIPTLPPLDV